MSAVALLHNHVLKQGDVASAAMGKAKGKLKQAQAPSEGLLLWARQVSGEGAHLKKWRLILRNLPFNVRTDHSSICTFVMQIAACHLCDCVTWMVYQSRNITQKPAKAPSRPGVAQA